MVHFYTAIIESILTSSITIWYAAATAKDKSRLQCIIRTAEKVISCNLPTLEDLHTSRTLRRVRKIVADPSHTGHSLPATPLRQKAAVHQDQNSFFPSVTGLFNKAKDSHWHSLIYLTIISPSNGNYTMHKPPYLSIWLHYVDRSCCSFLFLFVYVFYI